MFNNSATFHLLPLKATSDQRYYRVIKSLSHKKINSRPKSSRKDQKSNRNAAIYLLRCVKVWHLSQRYQKYTLIIQLISLPGSVVLNLTVKNKKGSVDLPCGTRTPSFGLNCLRWVAEKSGPLPGGSALPCLRLWPPTVGLEKRRVAVKSAARF